MGQIPDLVDVAPLGDLRDSIRAGYEEELGLWTSDTDVTEGIDGVGRALPVDVNAADGEAWIGRSGNHRHEVTVLACSDLPFHPRLASGNEDHFIKVELLLNFTCGDQVAVVDWIKGSTHNPDTLGALCLVGHEWCYLMTRSVATVGSGTCGATRLTTVAVGDIAVAPHNEPQHREDP